ncbi:MAG: hypothetical protein ABIJ95_08055 [Pseudomonadota bacterium]
MEKNAGKALGGDGGLEFFGGITASVSHELKNSLAVINEISGLMADLTAMAVRKGQTPDLERFGSLASRIGDQVSRADRIIKRLNRFSHTVDEQARMLDLGDAALFLCALCGRFADQRVVTLEVEAPETPVFVETSAFAFLLVGFLFLDHAMTQAGNGGRVNLTICRAGEGGAELGLSGTWTGPLCLGPEPLETLEIWENRLGIRTQGLGLDGAVTVLWPARSPVEAE